MAGDYAIARVSFFIALWRLLLLHYSSPGTDHRCNLNSNQVLAHWIYTAEITRDSAQLRYREFRERNRALLIFIGGMPLVFSLFFIIFVEDGGLIPGTFIFAFVLFVISWITPQTRTDPGT